MSQRKNEILVILSVVLGFCLLSFGTFLLLDRSFLRRSPPVQVQDTNKKNQLTLLGDTFSGYSTFRSQDFQSALKKVGLNLRYDNEFDQAKRANQINQGRADLLVTTLDQFLKQKPQGKIVGLIDYTAGADAVVLNTKKYPNLKSLLDLTKLVQQSRFKGQQLTITFAGDTPSEYLALLLSTKFESFKLSDFQVNKVADAVDAWKLLQDPNENVAVAVLWEPYVSQARQKGYTVVLSSKDVAESIVDVIVASNRLMESEPEKISQLLSAYYRHIDANVRDASQMRTQIATDGKLSATDAAVVLQGIDFFTAIETKDWLENGTLEKRIASTAAVLTLAGKMDQVPENPKELFTSQFILKAAENTQNLINLVRADQPELADRLVGKGKTITPTLDSNQITNAPNIGNLQVRGEIKFAFESTMLTDEGKQTLNKLAQEIAEFNEETIAVQVIGHTSRAGSVNDNQKLSQKRAEEVVAYMRARGLKHKFIPVGNGSKDPLPGISASDPRNQRTEIRLVTLDFLQK